MRYTMLIVDDEPLARKVILEFINNMENDAIILEAGDAVTAQKILAESKVDILFLDINMPLMTGLEFAASKAGDALTIFTTAYAEHAVEAFELAAFDYLVKPISYSRFQKSYSRALEHLNSDQPTENSWMMIKEGKRIYKVPYSEIYYLKAYGDYVKIFTQQKTYLMKSRLTKLDQQLPENFVRSHRSYIVNIEGISYLEGNHVVIDDKKIPISEGYRGQLLERL